MERRAGGTPALPKSSYDARGFLGESSSLPIARRRQACIGLASRGRAGKAITMARDEGVYGWAEPRKGAKPVRSGEPNQLRQNTQQGQPSFKSTHHFPSGVRMCIFPCRRSARGAGREPAPPPTGRYIQESHALTGIIRLNFRLRTIGRRAGTVQEMSYLGGCGIVLPRGYTTIYDTVSRYLSSRSNRKNSCAQVRIKREVRIYRKPARGDRPRGDLGRRWKALPCLRRLWKARLRSPIPTFISRCSFAQRGQKAFPVSRRAGWPVRSSRGCSSNIRDLTRS